MKNSNLHICSGSYKYTSQLFFYAKQIAKYAFFFLLLFGFVLPINLWAQDNEALLINERKVYEKNESLSNLDHSGWKLMGEIPDSRYYYNSETIRVKNNSVIILFKIEFNEEQKFDFFDEKYNGFVFVRLINCKKNLFNELVRNYYLDNEKLEYFSASVSSNWISTKTDETMDHISKKVACI